MRALVTGGAGFIGSHLVDALVGEGHDVTVLARPGEPLDNLSSARVRVVRGDVRDEDVVREAMAGAERVYHLAARTDLAGTSLADYDVNLSGTENVLRVSRAAGVKRLVFFSSMLAIGLTGSPEPIDETATHEPQSWYGRSKREGEALVRASGVPFAIIRPTLVYGPRERSTMQAFFSAVYRRRFLLIGGDVLQAFAYVKNVARAAYDASLHPGAEGGTFFVSDARPYTLAEFARAAASALGVGLWPVRLPRPAALAAGWALDRAGQMIGRELPLSVRRVRTMTTSYVYSVEAARRSFGFDPAFGLDDAARETARWYRDRNLV